MTTVVLTLLALAVLAAAGPAAARARLRALDDDAGRRPRRRWSPARLRRGTGAAAGVGGLLFGGIAHLGFGSLSLCCRSSPACWPASPPARC